MTQREVTRRRDDCYRFHLLGLSQEQIGEALHISQGQVSRYIDDVRKSKTWMSKPAKDRYAFLMQEVYDRTEVWYTEASRLYYAADITPEEKTARANLIGRCILSSLNVMAKFKPDMQALETEAQMEILREQHEKIERIIEEVRQKPKIGEQLPAYPSWNQLTKNG